MPKAKKKFTKQELLEKEKLFNEKEKIDKTVLTIDWMDAYVAKIHPEKIEEYARKCADTPVQVVNLQMSDNTRNKIDIKKIRNYFIEEFFPELTDEKVEEREKAKKAKKKTKKEEKEQLTPEEAIKRKLAELQKED